MAFWNSHPFVAFAKDATSGGYADFLLDNRLCTRRQISGLLKEHGIDSWGLIYKGNELACTVNKNDEAEASKILKRFMT